MNTDFRTKFIHKILLILLLIVFCYFSYKIYFVASSIYHIDIKRDIGNF